MDPASRRTCVLGDAACRHRASPEQAVFVIASHVVLLLCCCLCCFKTESYYLALADLDLADLELRDVYASVSYVLELKASSIWPGLRYFIMRPPP